MNINRLLEELMSIKNKFDDEGNAHLDKNDKRIISDAINTLFLMATLQGKYFKARKE